MLTGTANFSVAEALNASGGSIPDELQDNAQSVLEWLQAARTYLGRPIIITSLYRSQAHNDTVPGHASNSEHLRALGADFDVLGLSNHQGLSRILDGVAAGSIPTYHQLITYTTDHHIHVGLAAESWPNDEQDLVKTASGYVALTADMLASLANDTGAQVAQTVAQTVDVVKSVPGAAAAVAVLAAFFIVPALVGGHWT